MNLVLLLPEWIALGMLVVLAFREIFKGTRPQRSSGIWIPLAGTVLVLFSLWGLRNSSASAFGGTFILDSLALFFKAFFSLVAFVVIVSSEFFFRTLTREKVTEFFLILCCTLL